MAVQWIGTVLAILLVDLSLSGDNAVVIGAVASRLPPRRQRIAISFGILIAIVARLVLAVSAVLVLQLPFIRAVGGLVVLLIAMQMIYDHARGAAEEGAGVVAEEGARPARRSWRTLTGDEGLARAALIIVLADVSMSLDNILAVVALARGNMVALAAGILLSMVLLSVASALIARLIARLPVLLYAAALILAWTAGTMLLDDPRLSPMLAQLDARVPGPPLADAVAPVCVALVLLFGLLMLALRSGRKRKPA